MHLLFFPIIFSGVLIIPYLYYLHSISPVITSNIGFAKQTVRNSVQSAIKGHQRASKGIDIHAISDAES